MSPNVKKRKNYFNVIYGGLTFLFILYSFSTTVAAINVVSFAWRKKRTRETTSRVKTHPCKLSDN